MQSRPPAQRSGATRRLIVATLLGAAAPLAAGVVGGGVAPVAQAQEDRCFETRNEARYRPYGYDHYVIIKNGCPHDLTCSVSTNVNPGPIVVGVTAGSTLEVLTYQRSPSQAFTSTVTCTPD